MANRFDYRGGEHEVWLERVEEPILEPDLPIVDAHHHLWIRGDAPYLLREFAADLQRGHRVVATVFAECHSMYRTSGPEALRSVGEMEFVAGIAAMSEAGAFGSPGVCRAAVGGVDLTLGSAVEPVLDALTTASGGRFRGVRASVCWDASEALHRAAPRAGFLGEPAVRAGIAVLARRALSLDCWLYHPQIAELTAVADAYPTLTIILNHTGTPILGGPYRDRLDDVRRVWLAAMTDLARRDNVYVKLGALPAKFAGVEQGTRAAAEFGRRRNRMAAVDRAVHRTVRRAPLHVRVELPGPQELAVVSDPVERVQATRGARVARREDRTVRRYGDPCVSRRRCRDRLGRPSAQPSFEDRDHRARASDPPPRRPVGPNAAFGGRVKSGSPLSVIPYPGTYDPRAHPKWNPQYGPRLL